MFELDDKCKIIFTRATLTSAGISRRRVSVCLSVCVSVCLSVCLCVCLSVCLSHAGIVSKRLIIG